MDSHANRDYAVTALCLGVAGVVLGLALYLSGGFYNIPALQLTTGAYALCVLAIVLRKFEKLEEVARPLTPFILAAGLVFQFYRLGVDAAYAWPVAGLAFAVVAALTLRQSTLSVWWVTLGLVVALVVPHFLVGLWAIRGLANPDFDVYYCHVQSLDALVKGINPHTLTIAYVHPDELKYPASYVFDGRVHIGFPYPPLSLFMALPGYLVAGDYRYSGLAATTLAGVLMVYARPSRLGILAAAIFLSSPATFTVLKMGWTEPYVVLLLAVTVFCACRAPRLLPWALGLLIAAKQYAIFAALGVFLLPSARQSLKESAIIIGKALALATAITLPWMLWNVYGFLSDVVFLQFLLPFRMDALSYLVWLTYNTGRQPPAIIGFLMMAPAVGLMLWRGARTVAGFAAAVSFIFLSLFLFNKAAFINYYFFVIGALCCSTALAGQTFLHHKDSGALEG